MDFVKRKFFRRATSTSSGDIVYQSWLLQLPPARGLKKYLSRSHWRWMVLRYTAPQEGVLEMYTNVSCTRMTSKIRITRKYKVESGMTFSPGGFTNQLNMFSIRTDSQVHYLVAETQAEAEQWVLAICTTCGLDIPRRPKSPTPVEFPSEHWRPRTKSEHLPMKNKFFSPEEQMPRSNDPDYILLSECYVANELKQSAEAKDDSQMTLNKEKGTVAERQSGNLFLSSGQLNYDHPRPIHQRLRVLTSPDLRDIPPYSYPTQHPIENYCSEVGGMRKLLNTGNMHLPVVPILVNPSNYDTPPSRVMPVLKQTAANPPDANVELSCIPQHTYVNPPNPDVEQARADARQAALELEEAISRNSVTEWLHGSISPISTEVLGPEFFPFDIHPDKPPPRPPKPPHLRHEATPWNEDMIQVDLACPIYDIVPKPRPVLTTPNHNGKSVSTNNDNENKETNKNKGNPRCESSVHCISRNIEIPFHPVQDSSTTIKISPNTRVSRPIGGIWSGVAHVLYDTPKPTSHNSESPSTSTEVTKGVKMRRRPPTPPSQNLKHSFFPLNIDGIPAPDFQFKRRVSLTDQVPPLTQKQRISICKEVNYLDLAFTVDDGECSPKPLTRETVYYSVDFIKTRAFNETRQNVEEIYRNT